MKIRLMKILIGVFITVTCLCALQTAYFVAFKNSSTENIIVKSNGVTTENFNVNIDCLSPGEENTFNYHFISPTSSTLHFNINFEQIGEGTLQDYIDVTIILGENSYSNKLSTLFNTSKLEYDSDVKDMQIIYVLDSESGTEAYNKVVDFNVNIEVSLVNN